MKPIRSRREMQEARKSLHDLRAQLSLLRKTYRHDPDALELATRGLRPLIRETAHAIRMWTRAQAGELPPVLGCRNARTGELEVARQLRLLRQAAQLGQAELAQKLETRQANISRWEREGYDGYTLRQLQRIADALDCDLEVSFQRRNGSRRPR